MVAALADHLYSAIQPFVGFRVAPAFLAAKLLAFRNVCLLGDRELHPSNIRSALKARLVRCYEVLSAGNNREVRSYECVFHDNEGNRIQATIQQGLISKMKPMLREGDIYGIKNFIVTHNNNKFGATNNRFRIIIINKTTISQLFDDTFPRRMFQFKTFEQITSIENIYDAQLFDVIGILTNKPALQTRVNAKGTESKFVEIVLMDKEKKALNCTLWENCAYELLGQLRESEMLNIVILQMAKPNMYKGHIKACSAYYVTQVIVNGDMPEVNEFKSSLDDELSTITAAINVSQNSATAGSESIMNDISSAPTVLRTIEQLFDGHESGSFWILATIVAVEGVGGWAYVGCKRCAKKLTKVGQGFYCQKCKRHDQLGNLRYKLKVHVVDETGSAPLLLWDRECIQLIGKPIAELNSEDDLEEGMPAEIENALLDQKMLFMVQVSEGHSSNHNGAYSVLKITFDPTIVETFSFVNLDSQESNVVSTLETPKMNEGNISEGNETPSNGGASSKFLDDGLKRSLIDEFSATMSVKKTKTYIKKEKEQA